jgi:radical SAM superfamily enzyme YgiQ (UPF0313 family)
MKIILTRPDYHTHLITPPLGLGYLASYLEKYGHEVRIIDALNLSLSNEKIISSCKESGLIGIYCLSDFYLETKDLVRRLKLENLRVVVGGPHASALPQETLEDTGADFIVIGEGEQTLLELANALEHGRNTKDIPGLLSQEDSALKKRDFISDLDSIPFPDWFQIDPRKCKKAPHGAVIKNFPVAPIITSRGCPYICKFCASPHLWARTIRFRSPENVVDEIEFLVKDFGVKEIHFEDDNLTLKREHIEKICNLILERKLKISWATPNGVRADTLTKDLVRLMKKSGCYFLVFGIESGSQKILNNIHKKTDLGIIERAARLASSEGLITQGFFIFGLPGETEETIKETVDFAKKIPLDRAQFLLLDVLPGSALWDELGGAKIADWHRRSYQEVTWVPPTISKEALEKAPSRAFRSFFFRPKQFFRFIKYIKPYQLHFIIRRLLDFGIISGK